MGRNTQHKRKPGRKRAGGLQGQLINATEPIAREHIAAVGTDPDTILYPQIQILWHFVLPVGAIAALCFVLGIFPIEAEDIFSNVVTGRYLWQQKAIPDIDPFSYTGPHKWFLNRPLPSLVFFGAHSLGGLPGVQLLCAALLAMAYSLTYVVWMRRTKMPLTAFVVIGLTILCSCYWFQTRIYLFGYLLTAIYLLLITSLRTRAILWTIPLQVVWTNSHPSAVLGMFLVGVWCASRTVGRGSVDRYSISVMLGVLVANVLNPTGLGSYWKFFDELLGNHPSRTNILEWLPPFNPIVAAQPSTWWYFASLVVMARVSCVNLRHWREIRSARILFPITLVFLVLSLTSARHIPLYYMALMGLALCTFEYIRRERSGERIETIMRHYRYVVAGVVCAVIPLTASIVSFGYLSGTIDRRLGFGVNARKFPDKPIQILKDSRVAGNIFTDYGSGAYFLYQMYPAYKVYIDSARLDEVYGEAGFFHYMLIGNDLEALKNDIARYDIRAFIMPLPPTESEIVVPYRFLSADPAWRLAYFDDAYMLFVRADEAQARGIATFTYLNPFASVSQILKDRPDGESVLAEDFAKAERISPKAISILVLKVLYQLSKGDTAKASESVRKIERFCEENDPTTECRRIAAHHLLRFRPGQK